MRGSSCFPGEVRIVARFADASAAAAFVGGLPLSTNPASWRRNMVRDGAVVFWSGGSLVARRVAGAFQEAGAPVEWEEV